MVIIIGFPLSLFKFSSIPCCAALHWLWLHAASWYISIMMMLHGLSLGYLLCPIPSYLSWLCKCFTIHVLLPWFPTESAHGAPCYTFHCACCNNTCHQRSLPSNNYRQSGLPIYFICSDLDNHNVLKRHSICLLDWWKLLVNVLMCFLTSC